MSGIFQRCGEDDWRLKRCGPGDRRLVACTTGGWTCDYAVQGISGYADIEYLYRQFHYYCDSDACSLYSIAEMIGTGFNFSNVLYQYNPLYPFFCQCQSVPLVCQECTPYYNYTTREACWFVGSGLGAPYYIKYQPRGGSSHRRFVMQITRTATTTRFSMRATHYLMLPIRSTPYALKEWRCYENCESPCGNTIVGSAPISWAAFPYVVINPPPAQGSCEEAHILADNAIEVSEWRMTVVLPWRLSDNELLEPELYGYSNWFLQPGVTATLVIGNNGIMMSSAGRDPGSSDYAASWEAIQFRWPRRILTGTFIHSSGQLPLVRFASTRHLLYEWNNDSPCYCWGTCGGGNNQDEYQPWNLTFTIIPAVRYSECQL